MTANSMSSAPLSRTIQNPDPDSEDEAAQDAEDFLASLAYTHDDGYISPDDQVVRITANMMANDDVWMLTAADAVQTEPPASSATKSNETRNESPSTKPTTVELEAQFLQWERTRLTGHIRPSGYGPLNRISDSTGTLSKGVSVRRLLTPSPRASTVSSAETTKDPYPKSC